MMQRIQDYEAHEALLAAEAVHIKITLGTGWDGGKPTPEEEEFERLLALSDDELDAEILLQKEREEQG